MGCDVYVFKVDQTKIANKFTETANSTASFEEYLTQNNLEQAKTLDKLDAKVILFKIKTDLHQLSRDEFWEN